MQVPFPFHQADAEPFWPLWLGMMMFALWHHTFCSLCHYFIKSLWGNAGHLLCERKQQEQEQRYPSLPECAVHLCEQTVVWLPVFGIFSVPTDADVHSYCTQGLFKHWRTACAESWPGEKILCHTREMNPSQYCAWLSGLTVYLLSYPAPTFRHP